MQTISRQRFMTASSIFLILGIFWIGLSTTFPGSVTESGIQAPQEGFIAPDFTLETIDGKIITLSELRGQAILVNLWASWCGPCRREMPLVYRLQKQLKDKNIDFVLVNTAEDEDTIFEFLGSVAPDLHSYMDRDGELTELWAPRGLPTTFFIDPKGRKRYLALGGRPWDKPEYQQLLARMLEEQ